MTCVDNLREIVSIDKNEVESVRQERLLKRVREEVGYIITFLEDMGIDTSEGQIQKSFAHRDRYVFSLCPGAYVHLYMNYWVSGPIVYKGVKQEKGNGLHDKSIHRPADIQVILPKVKEPEPEKKSWIKRLIDGFKFSLGVNK